MRRASAAYLLLLMLPLPLRLLTGLRSVDGEREPRCLHPPSPPPLAGNNAGFQRLPFFLTLLPLFALTPRMCYTLRPCSSSSPQAQTNLQVFGSPPAAPPPPLLPSPLLSDVHSYLTSS